MFRLRYTSVLGFPGTWLINRMPCNFHRLRPLQTGHVVG